MKPIPPPSSGRGQTPFGAVPPLLRVPPPWPLWREQLPAVARKIGWFYLMWGATLGTMLAFGGFWPAPRIRENLAENLATISLLALIFAMRFPRERLWLPLYKIDPDLTERISRYIPRGETQLVVRICPYGEGHFALFAFRRGPDVLVSSFAAEKLHPDQMDFVLARLASYTPWQAAFLQEGLPMVGAMALLALVCVGVFDFVRLAFDSGPLALSIVPIAVLIGIGIYCSVTQIARVGQHHCDVRAVEKTGNLTAAMATIPMLSRMGVSVTEPKEMDDRLEKLREAFEGAHEPAL